MRSRDLKNELPRVGESEHDEPLVAFDSQALRRLKPRQLAARFAFGSVASLIAGAVSIVLGPWIGGLFLAFPAILPATLTLLEREDGRAAAGYDMQGAALGAVALIAFAAMLEPLLARWPAGPALGAAFAGWLALALTIYLMVELMRRRRATWRENRP